MTASTKALTFKAVVAGAVASLALMTAAPASALTTFNFGTGTDSLTSVGGSIAKTVGSITVTATAWSTPGLGASDLPAQAALGQYQNGLGVTSAGDDDGFFNPNSHTVDNVGRYDFVRLVFSQAVELDAVELVGYDVNWLSNGDSDAWLSYNNTSVFGTNAQWAVFTGNGATVNTGGTFNPGNVSASVWLIGAARTSEQNDGFKLKSVGVTASALPETTTWVMMIVGFGILGAGLRRREANMKGARPLLA